MVHRRGHRVLEGRSADDPGWAGDLLGLAILTALTLRAVFRLREARELLKMQPWQLAKLAGVSTAEIMIAEIEHADPSVARAHVDVIRRALEGAGIKFITEVKGEPGVRLWKAP